MKGNISDAMSKVRAKRLAWMQKKEKEGWTQQQIGDHLGISRQRVQKILAPFKERGNEAPRPD